MKKKLVSALLVAAMCMTALAGCGNKADDGDRNLNAGQALNKNRKKVKIRAQIYSPFLYKGCY